MDYSTVQLLDLPDEILIEILNKLNNIDVLCTVLGVNKRLERLARDTIFTDFLDLTTKSSLGGICSMSNIILDRFCSSILPQIHHNIKSLVLESSSIEHILIACVYPKLHKLTLYSIKPEVFIKYLADDSPIIRIFRQITHLKLFTIEYYNKISQINLNMNAYARLFSKNLPNLISFMLSSGWPTEEYDNVIVPMLRRMSNLKELYLYLHVENRPEFIDDVHIYKEILIYMPRLTAFFFNIISIDDLVGIQ
ncbi:unnamed protein product [Rotaria sp. Silwood1]|nr:unnamed protein product [Rotaria sp. Silwood1]